MNAANCLIWRFTSRTISDFDFQSLASLRPQARNPQIAGFARIVHLSMLCPRLLGDPLCRPGRAATSRGGNMKRIEFNYGRRLSAV